MIMNKQLILLSLLVIVLASLSGCINSSQEAQIPVSGSDENKAPVPIITIEGGFAPLPAYLESDDLDALVYAETIITFDALNSYDPDGVITDYEWFLYDNTNYEKPEIAHEFSLDTSNTHYPQIYTVILQVKDDDSAYESDEYRVGVVPLRQQLYFSSSTLSYDKPENSEQKLSVQLGILRKPTTLVYTFNQPLVLQKGGWNATIYLKKPLFTFIKNAAITVYTADGELLSESTIGVFLPQIITKTPSIHIGGMLTEACSIGSLELTISGISIGRKPSILYGGSTASTITFYSVYES